MREIKLTKGMVALVDDDDYEWLVCYRWRALVRRHSCYAYRSYCQSKTKIIEYMHRAILKRHNKLLDDSYKTDHINHDGLDNQKSNLRLCSQSQNLANKRIQSNNRSPSKFKGIYLHRINKKWVAQANHKYIGSFDTEIEAALAYDKVARETWGEYAQTNFQFTGC